MASGNRDCNGAFCVILADNFVKNGQIYICFCIFYNSLKGNNWRNIFEIQSDFLKVFDRKNGSFELQKLGFFGIFCWYVDGLKASVSGVF